ncbi:hypothetical protein UP17_16380 [Peribacillus simplex]|uniref:hypothetical protein n=1 Tax=Peribacillus simplex TaxID=1478 RepID=UPI0007770387|nr:hypothetical protein [Peribacillus simplex]AMM93857.1 hypothetical protein UP17_16380 [Peribacillus simplex]
MNLLPLYSAFFGALAGQVFSHYFTKRRDKQKEARETYQKFIYPSLNDVILYFETETHFRKGHDVERTIDSETLTSKISENIIFGNSNLINAIFNYNSSITFFDGRGYSKDVNMLSMYFWFLDYSIETFKRMGKIDKKIKKSVQLTQKKYGVWVLLTDLFGIDEAIEILKYHWMWKDSYLDKLSLRKLKTLMKKYNSTEIKEFIIEMKYVFEKDSKFDDGGPEHIIQIFETYLREVEGDKL